MIVHKIEDCPDRDSEFVKTYILQINPIDDYKFRRWLDIMNSYDDSRKATHNFNSLVREVMTDYDKDFNNEDDW